MRQAPARRAQRDQARGLTTAADVSIRPLGPDDAAELAALYRAQREFLTPFDPVREESFFTAEGQRPGLEGLGEDRVGPGRYRFGIVVEGAIVGMVNISNVIRGVFQNASLGYFVAQEQGGRGVASRGVGLVSEWGFREARLHRLEAATLLDNVPSQRVLLRNGFRPVGLCPHYLHIAGAWRDHVLFQRTVEDGDTLDPAHERELAALLAGAQ